MNKAKKIEDLRVEYRTYVQNFYIGISAIEEKSYLPYHEWLEQKLISEPQKGSVMDDLIPQVSCELCGYYCGNEHHANNFFTTKLPLVSEPTVKEPIELTDEYIYKLSLEHSDDRSEQTDYAIGMTKAREILTHHNKPKQVTEACDHTDENGYLAQFVCIKCGEQMQKF